MNLSIEYRAKNYDKSNCKHFKREHTKEEVYDSFEEGFIAGANEMLPIIKELLETLIKANLYVPPKFYGQGESVDNDHYLEIQTTLDKYQNDL